MANSSIINSVREANDPASTLNAQAQAQTAVAGPIQATANPAMPPASYSPPTQATPGTAATSSGSSTAATGSGATPPPASTPAPATPPLPTAPMPSAPPTPSVTLPTAPAASTYNPSTLGTPTAWNVSGNQTVQGQLAQVMDPNSPIIQQAMTQGKEYANDRGLLNSSIGQGAAMSAAYAAALPIAQADASTYAKAAGYNADEQNQFNVRNQDAQNQSGQFNANANNQMGQAQLSAQTQAVIAQLQAQTQTNLSYLDHQTQTNLANLDSATRTNLATIEANYHVLMQSNQSASNLFQQVTQNITNISMSNQMDAAAKQAAVDNQLKLLQSGMQVNGAVSNLNLGSLLDFSGMAPQTSGSASGGGDGSFFSPSGPVGAAIQRAAGQVAP